MLGGRLGFVCVQWEYMNVSFCVRALCEEMDAFGEKRGVNAVWPFCLIF